MTLLQRIVSIFVPGMAPIQRAKTLERRLEIERKIWLFEQDKKKIEPYKNDPSISEQIRAEIKEALWDVDNRIRELKRELMALDEDDKDLTRQIEKDIYKKY